MDQGRKHATIQSAKPVSIHRETQTQMNTATTVSPVVIPVLAEQQVMPATLVTTFAAFKAEEKFSFVRDYSPAQCTDIPSYRHAVIRYRNTDGTVTKKAKQVTVPALVLPDEYSLLEERARKVIQGVYEDEQDSLIKNLIDEKGASTIHWDVLTLDCVLASLTAVRISQRLTKEQIEAWFRVAMKPACDTRAAQICEAKGIAGEEKAKQLAGTINAYCARAVKLAAPVPNLGQNEAIALNNLLITSAVEDDMAKVLKAKLNQILHPKVVEDADL